VNKAMVNIGGDVWVDVASVLVVQPRTENGGLYRIPGCTVFLAGSDDPVYGTDAVPEVIQNLAKAAS
jgi:hypothetical protein